MLSFASSLCAKQTIAGAMQLYCVFANQFDLGQCCLFLTCLELAHTHTRWTRPYTTFDIPKELLDYYKRFVVLADVYMFWTPKAHLMFHLLHRASILGCPADYSTWEDESMNRWLKACLRMVSQANFEVLGYVKTMEYLSRRGVKRHLV